LSEASFAQLKPFVGAREARRIVEHFANLRASEAALKESAPLEG
jgi:hypothetical protein